MMHFVLADNDPIFATGGQIAAIVICLYALLFVLIAVVFNLVMAFALSWVREKAGLVKMLRPTVDSVNKTTEAVERGTPPPVNENRIIRTVAEGPLQVKKLDKQASRLADRVANTAIEFRARTIQVETVAKAFFTPKRLQRELEGLDRERAARRQISEIKSPGYRQLMDEKAPGTYVVATETSPQGNVQATVTSSQLRDAGSH